MARAAARLPDGTRLSDHVTPGVLTAAVPAALIDAVLADTGRQSRRQRQLPARVMVYYVVALALYAQASYGEVLRRLLEGLRWLRLAGTDPDPAGKSAITRARTRLGADPLKHLFRRVARPCAEPATPGPGTGAAAWWAWTAPPSTCPTRRRWSGASAARPPRAAPAAFPSCAHSASVRSVA